MNVGGGGGGGCNGENELCGGLEGESREASSSYFKEENDDQIS